LLALKTIKILAEILLLETWKPLPGKPKFCSVFSLLSIIRCNGSNGIRRYDASTKNTLQKPEILNIMLAHCSEAAWAFHG
jgi:hypothetical protein